MKKLSEIFFISIFHNNLLILCKSLKPFYENKNHTSYSSITQGRNIEVRRILIILNPTFE